MKPRKQVNETKYSKKNIPEEEYILDRLMGYTMSGIGIFLIFLKLMNSY